MSLTVVVQPRVDRWKTLLKPYGKTIHNACEAALDGSGLPSKLKLEVSVVLADDTFIRELNRDYRGKNKATNVLSFPNEDFSQDDPHIGDLVLALETIEDEAKKQHKTFRDHTTHLLVHGMLHLLGYDHEDDKEGDEMEAKEIKILKKLDITNPYL